MVIKVKLYYSPLLEIITIKQISKYASYSNFIYLFSHVTNIFGGIKMKKIILNL